MEDRAHTAAVRAYLLSLQDRISAAIEAEDGAARFREDSWERPEGGGGRSRVLAGGAVFEQAGIGYSPVYRPGLPPSGTVQPTDLPGPSVQGLRVFPGF